jgi:hypothetical protein
MHALFVEVRNDKKGAKIECDSLSKRRGCAYNRMHRKGAEMPNCESMQKVKLNKRPEPNTSPLMPAKGVGSRRHNHKRSRNTPDLNAAKPTNPVKADLVGSFKEHSIQPKYP